MKLLSFPWLVQENIQKFMEPTELLFLSFCSLRCRNLVSQMRHTPTYSEFGLEEPGKMSYALVKDIKRNNTTMLTWTWKSKFWGPVSEEWSWLKSKDIDFHCKIIFEADSTALLWCPSENQASRKRFATALHSHMCEVFRVEPEMQFDLSLDYMDELPYTNTVRDVTLFDTSVNSKVLDKFLETFQVTRVLFSKTMKPNNPLKDSKRLYHLSNMFIHSALWLNGSKLLGLNCEKFDVMDKFQLETWNSSTDKLEYSTPVREYGKNLLAQINRTEMGRSGVLVRQSDGLRAVLRAARGQFHFHILHS
ncbi:hypothetical protein CRE_26113 [Caenorhabditis remanei]|uniref:F-box domain-containing protein n=1 Tax=Caenorhabditis remanei TaxID=31234 RepID=E3LQ94_CAERE|nr:hypothetical protein CRE_26113 [Caenorhabditis remanei]